jgi:hypothetical protein
MGKAVILRLPAFRMTMSIPVPLSYICQDLQPINERPFQRLQGLARDLDCGVVTGVVTFSVDGVLRPVLIGCTHGPGRIEWRSKAENTAPSEIHRHNYF